MATITNKTKALSTLINMLIEQRNINQTLNVKNKTLEMQIVRLKEENSLKTSLLHNSEIHQGELDRKLNTMLSYLEQIFRGRDSGAAQEPATNRLLVATAAQPMTNNLPTIVYDQTNAATSTISEPAASYEYDITTVKGSPTPSG